MSVRDGRGGQGQAALADPFEVLHRSAERLAAHYDGIVSAETAERVVFESYAALKRTARIDVSILQWFRARAAVAAAE